MLLLRGITPLLKLANWMFARQVQMERRPVYRNIVLSVLVVFSFDLLTRQITRGQNGVSFILQPKNQPRRRLERCLLRVGPLRAMWLRMVMCVQVILASLKSVLQIPQPWMGLLTFGVMLTDQLY